MLICVILHYISNGYFLSVYYVEQSKTVWTQEEVMLM